MYSAYYNLQKKPFSMTPDPSFLYLTKQHREALAGLTYAILDRKGFLVLSGMAGSGKTTLLAWVLQKLPSDRVHPSVILNPTLTREEFLELAMLDFGIAEVPVSRCALLTGTWPCSISASPRYRSVKRSGCGSCKSTFWSAGRRARSMY